MEQASGHPWATRRASLLLLPFPLHLFACLLFLHFYISCAVSCDARGKGEFPWLQIPGIQPNSFLMVRSPSSCAWDHDLSKAQFGLTGHPPGGIAFQFGISGHGRLFFSVVLEPRSLGAHYSLSHIFGGLTLIIASFVSFLFKSHCFLTSRIESVFEPPRPNGALLLSKLVVAQDELGHFGIGVQLYFILLCQMGCLSADGATRIYLDIYI